MNIPTSARSFLLILALGSGPACAEDRIKDQVFLDGSSLSLSGVPQGGEVRIHAGLVVDGEPSLVSTTRTAAGESLRTIASRLVASTDSRSVFRVEEQPGTPTPVRLKIVRSSLSFLSSTDPGIMVPPVVATVAFDASTKTLSWTVPPGAAYDSFVIARNLAVIRHVDGAARSFIDDVGETAADDLDELKGWLQYWMVGVRDGACALPRRLIVSRPDVQGH